MMIIQTGSYTSKLGNTNINYLVSLPSDYDKNKRYPLIIALSGDGAKASTGIDRMRSEGMNAPISKGMEIPFIVFSPQTPFTSYETVDNGIYRPGVMSAEAVDIAYSRYSVDLNRVYIFSLSMSGPSAPNALAYFPDKFAAGITVGSWETDIKEAIKIKGGLLDIKTCNDPAGGRAYYNISFIEACKNAKEAKYVVLDGSGHWGWFEASSNSWIGMKTCPEFPNSSKPENIYNWLLKFSLDGVITPPVEPPIEPETPPVNPNPTNIGQMIIKDSTGKVLLGKIEAEAYSATNKTGVFLENSTQGTKDVGWNSPGHYLEYNVTIPIDGTYQIDLSVATVKNAQIKVSCGEVSNIVDLPNSAGWQNWKVVSTQLKLVAGAQKLRITAITDGFNLDFLNISLHSVTINGFLIQD